MYKPLLSIILSVTLFGACKNNGNDPGFDAEVLFANITETEIDAVKMDWASRNLSPTDYAVEQSDQLGDGVTLKMISYRVNGFTEYAALIIPPGNDPMPIRIFINGFSLSTTVNTVNFRFGANAFNTPFILAVPALKGQSLSLTLNDVTYTSPTAEGQHCDAFDGTTDGLIGLITAIENSEPTADTERVSAQGGSRGGTVAMLLGIRDSRVKRVVSVAGPTDLVALTSQNQSDPTYRCQFLADLLNQNATEAEIRRNLIASSPLFFAEDLPLTQLHMGADDNIVPVGQGEALRDRVSTLGLNDQFQLFVYDGRNHQNLSVDNIALSERIQEFLQDL